MRTSPNEYVLAFDFSLDTLDVARRAQAAGLLLGICTTANEKTAAAITRGMLADIEFSFVLAGDVVAHKKPHPAIYNLALERSGLAPEECLVVEDSHNGLKAAKGAGLKVVATTNAYTEGEDLSAADMVVTALGDPDGERGMLKKSVRPLVYDGVLHMQQLARAFAA